MFILQRLHKQPNALLPSAKKQSHKPPSKETELYFMLIKQIACLSDISYLKGMQPSSGSNLSLNIDG